MKGLGVLAVVAVIVQGVLGGTRVTQVSTLLAAVHGVVGQAFFGLDGRALRLDRQGWQERRAPSVDIDRLAPACPVRSWVWSAPRSRWGAGCGITARGRHLSVHGFMALAVWAYAVLFLQGENAAARPGPPWCRRRWRSAVASSLQIVLGIVAMVYLLPFDGIPRPVSFYQAVVRTGHQTNGALLLAATVVLVLRTVPTSGAGSTSGRSPDFDRGERGR